MSLSRSIRKQLRRYALLTVMGAGLSTPLIVQNFSFGQQPELTPRLLPVSTGEMRPLTPVPAPAVSGGVLVPSQPAPRDVQAQQAVVQDSNALELGSTQTQYVDPVEKPNLFRRIFQGLKPDRSPAGPPQDPGMRYPKRNEQPARTAAKPPPAADQNLVLTPPSFNVAPSNAPTGDILVPPGGGSDLQNYLGAQPATTTLNSADMLVPPVVGGPPTSPASPPITQLTPQPLTPTPLAPAPLTPPAVSSVPLITPAVPDPATAPAESQPVITPRRTLEPAAPGAAPMASPQLSLQPEAQSENRLLLTPAPIDQAPAALPVIQAAPPIQPLPEAAPELLSDPLENAFPDDVAMETEEADSTTPASAPEAETEQEIVEPYTGLKLEEEMFQAPIPVPATAGETASEATSPMELNPSAVEPGELRPTLPPVLEVEQPKPTPQPLGTVTIERTPADTAVEPAAPLTPMLQAPPTLSLPAESPMRTAPAELPARATLPSTEPQLRQQPVVEEKPVMPASTAQHDQKLQKIRARSNQSGLKGFCAVALRDSRELLDTHEEYSALFNGKLFSFSSEAALETFLNEPLKYAPANRGNDVIHQALTGEELEGSLDYAVWYQGRLYLFGSVETMETFTAAPSSHATND